MSTPDGFHPPTAADRRVEQDVAAVVVILVGLVVLVFCAWQVDPWLLGVLAGVGLVGGGVYLGTER